MALVFGIGSGLFSLGIIWILGLILCLVISRSGKQPAVIGVGILLILISVAMVTWPREDKGEVEETIPDEKLDKTAIPRAIYASFMGLSVLVAIALYFVDHVIKPTPAMPVKAKKSYAF